MHYSYLGLGSNLQHPSKQVKTAIKKLSAILGIKVVAQSTLHQTKPVLHPQNCTDIQADYINAVIQIETDLTPLDLLTVCQQIECQMGRVRTDKPWAARIIDIDILLYDDVVLHTENLILPHPEMKKRKFVLEPLFEITPDLVLPDGTSIKQLVK